MRPSPSRLLWFRSWEETCRTLARGDSRCGWTRRTRRIPKARATGLGRIAPFSQSLLTEPNADTQATLILRLEIAVHSLTSSAALAQANALAHMASALDVFSRNSTRSRRTNASAVRTVHQGTEFLGELFRHAFDRRGNPAGPFRILIVDDEAIARKAVSTALSRPDERVSVEDPSAPSSCWQEPFQLVISDIRMPGMNGLSSAKNADSPRPCFNAGDFCDGFGRFPGEDAIRPERGNGFHRQTIFIDGAGRQGADAPPERPVASGDSRFSAIGSESRS